MQRINTAYGIMATFVASDARFVFGLHSCTVQCNILAINGPLLQWRYDEILTGINPRPHTVVLRWLEVVQTGLLAARVSE